MEREYGISGNALKIIAAILMVVDHVGVLFFPSVQLLRYIGRLSYPIFAFMISEGARYTKNKLRYFLMTFGLAVICQIVYYFFDDGNLFMCILVTFSLSILVIYLMQALKKLCAESTLPIALKILITVTAGVTALVLLYLLNEALDIDYGFFGTLVPVFASVFDFRGIRVSDRVRELDNLTLRVFTMGLGLVLLASQMRTSQYLALLSLPLLLLYSGKRGKRKMKYFFYIFYPLHLALLQGIYMITR